jgi:hypothetical protein
MLRMARTLGSFRLWLHATVLSGLGLALAGCGVADPTAPGRCEKGEPTNTVAGGKGSVVFVQPSSENIKCADPESGSTAPVVGTLQFIAVVRDATEIPIAGVSVGATVPQNSGLVLVTEQNIENVKTRVTNTTGGELTLYPTDTYTDKCGTAIISIVYTCPTTQGRAVGGNLVVFSGSLLSSPIPISVELTEDEDE